MPIGPSQGVGNGVMRGHLDVAVAPEASVREARTVPLRPIFGYMTGNESLSRLLIEVLGGLSSDVRRIVGGTSGVDTDCLLVGSDMCEELEATTLRRPLSGRRVALLGPACPRTLFGLSRTRAIDAYVHDPFDIHQLRSQCEVLIQSPCSTDVGEAAKAIVGIQGVKEVQRLVRRVMFREALRMTNGNRHAAARLLRVDRRYVLKMIAEGIDLAS